MIVTDLQTALPADLAPGGDLQLEKSNIKIVGDSTGNSIEISDDEIKTFIVATRQGLHTDRHTKQLLWDECWSLYRGKDTFPDKEDWQSKIVMPKAWNSVKQATNAMMRMLQASEMPWTIDPINPDDQTSVLRAEQITDLTRLFLQNSDFIRAFAEGLESSFITGLGIWKVWWGFKDRNKMISRDNTENGQREIIRQTISEGNLFIRAVDPYMFYWLKGSRFGNWTGTIEDIEVTRPQLIELEDKGIIPEGSTAKIKAGKSINEDKSRASLRFDETHEQSNSAAPSNNTIIKLTDYYGPILDQDGNVKFKQAHVLLANDDVVLVAKENKLWTQQPPYVAFSPLLLPFREEGVGLIEHTVDVDKAFNRIINMTTDKQLLGLIPALEVDVDLLEDPSQLDTGLVPGKIIRKEGGHAGQQAIQPIIQDTNISPAAQLLLGALDRGHQEGSLISEIQQSLPRFRGNQTGQEISIKQGNQVDFLSAMSKDIDEYALKPIVEASMDLVLQFLNTSNDPRVGSILGVGQEYLRSLNRFDLLEMIQGDYIIKVSGVTDQVQKREALGEIVQLMNIIGQNAEAWMPFINQTELLNRVLEGFPGLRDSHNIVETPENVEAKRIALQNSQLTPEILKMMPHILKIAAEINRQDVQNTPEGQPLAGGVQQFAQNVQPQVEQVLQQQQVQQQDAEVKKEEIANLEFEAYKAQLQRVISGTQDSVKKT